MKSNLLLEQYSWYKKQQLAKAPFECLLNADIEPNPHQVNAFCAAIQALKTGGIILADEVGLGKTIEAGLVLNYVLDNGAKKVLISLPATLRKQWEVELLEKFGRQAVILDRYTVEHDLANVQTHLGNADEVSIVIASYDYSSKLIKRFPHVKWDFLIIDEAHNLRNVFHGTKRAKNLYDLTHGIPKILLTATPLQNSLTDLHGLVSFIDPRIFGSEKVFNRRFVDGCDYEKLKQELLPVLYRTLRRDVGKYMAFSKRTCITVDFHLTAEEKELYDVTNDFLRRDPLYSIPNANRGLIILVIRKLLASSSFALIETFEVLEKRLEKLYEGTKSAYAQEGFDLFWGYVEDEIDEEGFNEYDDEETAEKKQAIQAELKIVRHILEMARAIKTNAKIIALREALKSAFDHQISEGLNQKAVVFTESKRTQKYIAAELRKSGYSEEDILLFNGDFDDAMTKEIFRTWQVKNFGKTNYGRNVEYKHAIVDYFKSHAKILIVTDAGSEGLNLQFCNTIINYDLPWNPQKIEQRIGRCHRYGQTHDVVAINLLNTDNEADRRVYDILSKKFELFEGVFGASDVALGALESGVSFEKRILEIYQNCKNITAVRKAFAALNRQLDARKNAHAAELRSILLTESREAKGQALEKTKADIDKYLCDVEYWNQFKEPEVDHKLHYWKIDNWGEKIFGSHGVLFLGAFMDNTKLLFPVLLLCDENGEYINFTEDEIVSALEEANDSDVRYFKPTEEEQSYFHRIYTRLISEVQDQHDKTVAPTIAYNKKKIENWVNIQQEQLHVQLTDAQKEVEEYILAEMAATDTLEKKDIRKKAAEAKKKMDKLQHDLPKRRKEIQDEAQAEKEKGKKIIDGRLASYLGVDCFYTPRTSYSGDIPVVSFPYMHVCSNVKCGRIFDLRENFDLDRYLKFGVTCPECHRQAYPSRFITICENGHMDDFPWSWWVHGVNTICKGTMRMYSTGNTSTLADMWVKCSCGARRSMSGATQHENFEGMKCSGHHPFRPNHKNEKCDKEMIPSQRGASNVYFPVMRSAISIPPWINPLYNLIDEHLRDIELAKTLMGDDGVAKIYELYFGAYAKDEFDAALERRQQNIKEFTEIKQMEYNAITHHADPVYASNKKHFKAEEDPLPDYLLPYFKRVIRITRLREVRVLLGFTRVDAPDPDADEQTNIVYLNKGKTEKWLPAAEVHGEGVFIEFNRDSIDAWLRDPELGALSQKYAQCYKEFCESKEWTVTTLRDARYVLMHTFAHLLIKQMSMSSGYSSSAIRERIYFGDDMSGVLLYTGSADKEGSLGGLVELGNIDQLIVLMKDAFQEALVCTNDPECLNNVPAGNNSNGAACHSCCMISETACENGNRMLDRGLIVPIDGRENQSYFKTLVEELCQLEV